MARVRVRQHVNPLSSKYQQSLSLPDWSQIYSNLSLPLHLDIGCARGRFLLEMAPQNPDINFLGFEIREPLVIEANQLRDEENLTNLHYLFGNINTSLEDILNSLPADKIELVMVQFPDPWFKKKHHKRRVIQPETVATLAKFLKSGSQIFLQSDIKEVAEEMCDRFLAHPSFNPLQSEIWLTENPIGVMTEREIATLNKGEPVYRTMLVRE
ncbi:tRNA (guanosine(46)-N7)-methyltransferase TrmB [Cyanobacterium sp. IPPAS B-1200]|uniref:tRNA (guanosine(46)-N7)-methyltransferase TrmB n=1 Tax=Cyanobacterium sp. IPPAS B-1200 TaxID=1562720 RepID=UPI0008524D99|nr:tRNA (guanosine(46)-N7)-methyltransferase TrmB [Cyanobacterium sp. IPPAS B-1200]OEJ79742.1 tRNA (guanosine(46)-N7)-methyltransferase TrmB [Cyanobacterium sp. IPPAS B-1200]